MLFSIWICPYTMVGILSAWCAGVALTQDLEGRPMLGELLRDTALGRDAGLRGLLGLLVLREGGRRGGLNSVTGDGGVGDTEPPGTREEPGTLTQGAPVFPGSSRLRTQNSRLACARPNQGVE